MSNYLPTTPYRGTRDFLPAEMSVRTQVFHALYEVIERYGYGRYDGPILEPVEMYEAKSSREIVEQQLYTMTDRGGRRLALRPEMTPSVARIIAGNAGSLQFPVRWYSHPNCHRYERPQRGRVREHWQINVDMFGSDNAAVEIEFFEMIHDMMAALGAIPDMWVLRVNDRVLLDSMLTDVVGVPADAVRDVSSLVDRWEKYDAGKLAADAAEIGLTDKQFARLSEAVAAGTALLDEFPDEVKNRSRLVEVMRDNTVRELITYDPLIVRGFDYYTSTVFEVFDQHPDNRRSLFGGGRYDNLVGLYSSQRIPGFGFGMGDVTLFDFLDAHGLTPEPRSDVDVVVIPLDEDLSAVARQVARSTRAAGLRATTTLDSRKLGKEIQRAVKSGAFAIVIVGRDEVNDGQVTVRDLRTGDQRNVEIDQVGQAVAEIRA
ncbi:MAG: histidine--tRNA ligase [Haloechinothrix sp.]